MTMMVKELEKQVRKEEGKDAEDHVAYIFHCLPGRI